MRNLTDIELDATEPSKYIFLATPNNISTFQVTDDEFNKRLQIPQEFKPPVTPPPLPPLSTNVGDYLSDAVFINLVNATTEEPIQNDQKNFQKQEQLDNQESIFKFDQQKSVFY